MATLSLQFITSFCLIVQPMYLNGQSCLQSGNGLPFFLDYGGRQDSITVGHQAIIPTYKFECNEMCGHITEWGVDVQPGGDPHNNRYTLDLQVWRPSPTVDDATGTGCYSLVGSNRFTSIPLANDVAKVTPSPQDYIQFQPGDVLGFYVERGKEDDNGVNILRSFNNLVWHAKIESPTSRNGGCPYSVGSNGVLSTSTRAAPVISIATATFPCTISADSGSASTGRTFGIVFAVLILIALVVVVIIGVALFLNKHRTRLFQSTQGRAFLDNILYFQRKDVDIPATTQASDGNITAKTDMQPYTYDYIVNDDTHFAVHHDLRNNDKSSGAGMKNDTSTSPKHALDSNIYEACDTHKSTNRHQNSQQTQDVFDEAGFYVPTWNERESMERNHYEMETRKPYTCNKLEFFVEDEIYWPPAATTSDLYSQLASRKYREIPRDQLTLLEQLGSGEFGEVCKALWSVSGATKELAIKTVKPQLPEEQKVRFLQEAAIMGQFSHPNIVKLFGVVTIGDPAMICIELLSKGDLREYLCSIDPSKSKSGPEELHLDKRLLQFSKQIASGMNYLSKKSFVHRDLAARNVLLDDELNCKIADFGMARDLEDETYYTPKSKVGKIPIKWTAPEALLYKKYSTDSDVWSYGMVLFEIWSVGKKPFSEVTNTEALRLMKSKYNQPPPPGCPIAIYKIMVDCWHPVHNKRPSFSEICNFLKTPPQQLLWWNDQDNATSQQARKLGAPLSEAKFLYQEIQNIYTDNVH